MNKKTLFLGLLLFSCWSLFAQEIPSVKLKDLNGKVISTDSFLKPGHPFIISFFGTWCKPCLKELDAIQEVYDEWQEDTNVTLYAISIDEGSDVSKVKPMAHAHGWEFDILSDANGNLKQAMGVNLVPCLFIYDGKGKLVHQKTGYVEGSISEIRKILNKIKSEK